MDRGKKVGVVLRLALILLLLFVLLFSLLMIGKNTMDARRVQQTYETRTVVYDGVEYYPRQDIDVLLVMGIDKEGPVEASNSYNNDGEADTLLLLVFDHTEKKIHALNINRDTMAQMPVLGVGGKQASDRKEA